jgi:serine/threonine protein kinase
MSDTPNPDDDRTVIRPGGRAEHPAPAAADATVISVSSSVSIAPPPQPAKAATADDNGNALPLGTYLGEFELVQVLGEGGFGIVYQAWDHSLERKVALKEYMPSSLAARGGGTTVQVKSERHRETFEAGRKSFVNEAKLLAQFDHPALVKVYRFWEDNGTAYMVMPLYEGITLKDHLKKRGSPPDEAWLMGLLGPLTEALGVIHAESCFHRDIAPDNVILLASTGRPLLLDFGAARRVIGDMTQALTVILKPGYAPIEQYADAPHMKQGAWTDIYALAASVHFALLGRTPPPSVSRMMTDTYKPLSEQLAGRYSERFLAALDRALIVKPEARTQSITDLRTDLGLTEQVEMQTTLVTRVVPSASAGTSDKRQKPATRAEASAGRGPGVWIGAAVVALAVTGGGAYFATRAKSAGPDTAGPASSAEPVAPPSPPPAPPLAATVPTHFDALQQFETVIGAQTSGWQITAQPAKGALKIGKDKLGFSVTSSQTGYLTVLLLGPDGSLLRLFPNDQAMDNHVQQGQTIKLPGSSWPLEAADPPGDEHFLAIVSAVPRDYSKLSTEHEDMFLKLPTGSKADALMASWSQPSPFLLGLPSSNCSGNDCIAYGAANFSVVVVR